MLLVNWYIIVIADSVLLCRCAGVCSYEGHGGLCSIRLSEPLLKFRPRKDVIETLLVGVVVTRKDYVYCMLYIVTAVILSFSISTLFPQNKCCHFMSQ